MGQLLGMGVVGLLIGLLTQKFANKRHQEALGKIALISCIMAAFIGGFMGLYWGLAALTAIGFMAYIQLKA
jgi:hypothetical protein